MQDDNPMTAIKKIATLSILAGMFALAACNTVEGVGQDIQSVGRKGKEVIN
jgi:predicted small secreted protein